MSTLEIMIWCAAGAALAAAGFFLLRLYDRLEVLSEQLDQAKHSVAEAREERDAAVARVDEVNAYLDRFPTLRKMERLLNKGDSLAELFELADDDVLQAMAWGGAALLARDDEGLLELVEKKGEFLAGRCTENDVTEFVASRMLELSYADGDYGKPKTLTPRQRAVISGVATTGAGAFATFLKHATEEKKRERDRAEQAAKAADRAAA